MSSHAVSYALLHRRGSRAFFLTRSAQHLESLRLGREIARVAVALGAVIAWGGVCLLVAG
jgi:hypothetical protein